MVELSSVASAIPVVQSSAAESHIARFALIDGSVALTRSGDSLRQVLNDWTQYGAAAANVADIRSRLAVTYNNSNANILNAGSGLDWFWYTYAKDSTNRKATDLLN